MGGFISAAEMMGPKKRRGGRPAVYMAIPDIILHPGGRLSQDTYSSFWIKLYPPLKPPRVPLFSLCFPLEIYL